ncbi:MAG: permease-like cell division protein FtsX [Candidatus Margulisbacteria bacterium]|nr:permease-like cell division protein FtsX [Candidatus Margulisiibacteriota bacterium]
MFSNLEFFIVEALRSFRRGALMTVVAIGTITVTLVIFGVFLLLVVNLGNIVGNVSSGLDIAAYVDEPISLEQAGAIQLELSKLSGVEKVDFISRAEAWKKFQEDFGEKLEIGEVIQDNPLPHTFIIKVRTPDLLPKIAQIVSQKSAISEVRYSGKLIDQMRSLVGVVRVGGTILVILVTFATLLIVVNTIRLTVLARETDIYIMKLVGATNNFVKYPFIIEGVLIGIIGGVLAFIILKISYDSVIFQVSSALPFLPIVAGGFILGIIYSVMVFAGTALGMLGAYISVSRVLKAEF